jgi:deoxyribonuclease V
LGLVTGWRTIGCAKSRLTGEAETPELEKGSRTPLLDRGERIGTLLRTRSGVKPVWVSPGHGVGIRDAGVWVLRTANRYRLPEPIRCAHKAAGAERQRLKQGE